MWQKVLQSSGGSGGTAKLWHDNKTTPYNTKQVFDVGFKPCAIYACQSKNGFNDPPTSANRISYIEAEGQSFLHAQQGTIDMSSYYIIKITDTGFEFTNNAGAYIYGTEFIVVGV